APGMMPPGAQPLTAGGGTSGRATSRLRDAEDEVELLRAQLEGKTAESQEARAMLKGARRKLERMQHLEQTGAVQAEVAGQGRPDIEILQARLQSRDAQVREAQLRLKQAERRLAELKGLSERPGRPGGMGPGAGGLPGGAGPGVGGPTGT